MNVKSTPNYFQMAEEYYKSAEDMKKLMEKFKADNALKAKNPKEYNSKIASVRAIYNDCIYSGNILKERAERYENA